MHRNTPRLHDAQAERREVISDWLEMWCSEGTREHVRAPTWVARMAVGADIVPGDSLHQLIKLLLVARLLALAQSSGHGWRWSRGRPGLRLVRVVSRDKRACYTRYISIMGRDRSIDG